MQRVLLVAVIALSLNALAGMAGVGGASRKTGAVKVLSAVLYTVKSGPAESISAGQNASTHAQCPAGSSIDSGGYLVHGNYALAPPSVTGSYPSGTDRWVVFVTDPKTGGPATFRAYVICEKVTYATVQGA